MSKKTQHWRSALRQVLNIKRSVYTESLSSKKTRRCHVTTNTDMMFP